MATSIVGLASNNFNDPGSVMGPNRGDKMTYENHQRTKESRNLAIYLGWEGEGGRGETASETVSQQKICRESAEENRNRIF